MRVLVFGKSGQVAKELARFDGVQCLDRTQADLRDVDACVAHIKTTEADVIINAAAYTAVDKAEEEETLANQINGKTVGALATSAAARRLPFLHISTDYVFDGGGTDPWQPTDATGPIGAYGRSKLIGENAVVAAGGPHAILRTSWVYSSHGTNFVKTMLRLGAERGALSIVSDQIGGPTAAHDIAAALMRMAKQFHAGTGQSGIYHFSGAPDVSWLDFANEIFAQAGLNVAVTGMPTKDYLTPAQRPLNSRMDCSDLRHIFGIERTNWRDSLADVLAQLGENNADT